jgi:putative membrane protein
MPCWRGDRVRGEIPEGETLWREALASERTMLSWVRTGLNTIGFGILLHAIARISSVLLRVHNRVPASELSFIGLTVVAIGALIEVVALILFIRFRRDIRQGYFTNWVTLYLLIALGVLLFGVAFVVYTVSS